MVLMSLLSFSISFQSEDRGSSCCLLADLGPVCLFHCATGDLQNYQKPAQVINSCK